MDSAHNLIHDDVDKVFVKHDVDENENDVQDGKNSHRSCHRRNTSR
jgi:hypothetical protein